MDMSISLVRRGSFNPAILFEGGVAGGWYDPSDLTTLFQDSAGTTPVTAHGDPVGLMRDKSGSGHHLSQGTAARCPLYQESGSEKFLLFDGVDDFLGTAITITLPFDRISAIQQVTWTLNDVIFWAASTAGTLNQNDSTPELRILTGTGAGQVRTSLAVGTNGVITERHIANASQIALNNEAYVTGDAGATAPTSFQIGASSAATVASNMRFYGSIMRAGSLSGTQIEQVRKYLGGKCAVAL